MNKDLIVCDHCKKEAPRQESIFRVEEGAFIGLTLIDYGQIVNGKHTCEREYVDLCSVKCLKAYVDMLPTLPEDIDGKQ